MKRFILLISLILFAFAVSAQDGSTVAKAFKVTADGSYSANGASTDIIIKNGYNDYFILVTPFCDYVKLNAKITRTVGTYSKFRVVVMTSYDGVNWVRSDSVSVASATAAQNLRTTIFNAKAPYLKFRTYAYDSTQTQKLQYFYIIDRP